MRDYLKGNARYAVELSFLKISHPAGPVSCDISDGMQTLTFAGS